MRAGAMADKTGAMDTTDADIERRFGGLRRLYGDERYARLRALRVAVVGLGGVGSWAVEALARSGVARLTLVDMDHVAESNINRQVQATTDTLGMGKGDALAQRIAGIHPGCDLSVVDAFVEPGNWPGLLGAPVDVVIDACDQLRAKALLASWAHSERMQLVCTGAAGGKRNTAGIEIDDLARVTHDPLLAALRSRLRREHSRLRGATSFGLRCVFSREAVAMPRAAGREPGAGAAGDVDDEAAATDGTLNCHGYGSSVMVTASFGMAAAAEAVSLALAAHA